MLNSKHSRAHTNVERLSLHIRATHILSLWQFSITKIKAEKMRVVL